jgi:hypothetical protein
MQSPNGCHLSRLGNIGFLGRYSTQSYLQREPQNGGNCRQDEVGSMRHTKLNYMPSRVPGSADSLRRIDLSSPPSSCHTPCSSQPRGKMGGECLSCQGKQKEKCNVSPINNGSCSSEGQKGREPGGSSKTMSLVLYNFCCHRWVASLGTTKIWLRCVCLWQEYISSSMAMSAAAGGGHQSSQSSLVGVGCQNPQESVCPPSTPCPRSNHSAGARGRRVSQPDQSQSQGRREGCRKSADMCRGIYDSIDVLVMIPSGRQPRDSPSVP